MAVSLTSDDLIQPTGELTAVLFPGDDLIALVIGWLMQATDKVEASAGIDASDHNDAAAAWVYYRAGKHIAHRLAASPASRRLGPASQSMDADQRSYWLKYAAAKLAEYGSYDTVAPVVRASGHSMPVPNVAVW
jgi:hypothetical protein